MKKCKTQKHLYTPIPGAKEGCPFCVKEKKRLYYIKNKDNILQQQKEIRKDKEKYNSKQRELYYNNKEDRLNKKRKYYKENKSKHNKWRKTINKKECQLFKICTKCKIEKYHTNYSKTKEGTELYSRCSSCKSKQIVTEKTKQNSKNKRTINKEKLKKYQQIYLKNNKGKRNHWTAKRRSQKLKATPTWLTSEQLKEIESFYVLAKELQWLSDPTDPLCVDHIEPLQGKDRCGLHVPWNLQVLPKSLNSKKGNKTE